MYTLSGMLKKKQDGIPKKRQEKSKQKSYIYYIISYINLDQASEFICIDSDPDYIEGSRQLNNNGLLIYPWQIE